MAKGVLNLILSAIFTSISSSSSSSSLTLLSYIKKIGLPIKKKEGTRACQ